MNLTETLALIEALKSAGVTKFKSLEHDITFDAQVPLRSKLENSDTQCLPHKQEDMERSVPSPLPIPEPVIAPVLTPDQIAKEAEAIEKMKEMMQTVNMTHEQLADKMFPSEAE